MICDIATPVGGVKLDIHLRKQMIGREQMFASAVTPECNYMRMLAEQQHIWNRTIFARLHQFPLKIARQLIRRKAKLYCPADFIFLIHVRFWSEPRC